MIQVDEGSVVKSHRASRGFGCVTAAVLAGQTQHGNAPQQTRRFLELNVQLPAAFDDCSPVPSGAAGVFAGCLLEERGQAPAPTAVNALGQATAAVGPQADGCKFRRPRQAADSAGKIFDFHGASPDWTANVLAVP
jgi:hypothetical protein